MATSTVAEERERRRRGARSAPRSIFGDFADVAEQHAQPDHAAQWPNERWAADPVGFSRTILGVELWSRQIEFLEAIRDHRRIAVSGGRKIGKDFGVAVAALWWYASFHDARVIMMATKGSQVDGVLWRDIRKLYQGSGRCLECKKGAPKGPSPCPHSAVLTGDIHELARSGLKAPDLREITGHTAREAEAIAGTSGARLLYILDEASGIDDDIHIAIVGNLASGQGREVLISNPTQNAGFFFEAFHARKDQYRRFVVSSEESPNVVQGREVIPGLADAEWIEARKRDWGEDSATYAVHVKGQFAQNEENKIFPLHQLSLSTKRWDETEGIGRLQVGIDVAGEGEKGDESIFVARRGMRMLTLNAYRGLSADAHLVNLIGLLRTHRKPRDATPLVCVDREGPVGYKVWTRLRAYADEHPDVFDVAGVRASDGAVHQPAEYDRRRDELWGAASQWLREGGAILEDPKLTAELHTPQWIRDLRGRNKVTPKRDLKKILKRSPDRAEAFVLSVWVPAEHELGGDGYPSTTAKSGAAEGTEGHGGIDPYALEGVPDFSTKDPIYGD